MGKFSTFLVAMLAVGLFAAGVFLGNAFFEKFRNRPPYRPDVCDRTGRVLLTDRRDSMFAIPKRHAECGGQFASSLLGHTVIRGRGRKGAIGIESVIDRSGITKPEIFLTMDAGIQEQCEDFLDRILAVRVPFYTYVTVLDSEGSLIAAAQRPSMDLNDRSRIGYQELIFMAPSYVFPVSDAWMRLLGSSSGAEPLDKAKFRFHQSPGIFSGESCGRVLGLKRPEWKSGDAQSATVLTYLLAYIGVTEEIPIPSLKVILPGSRPYPPRRVTGAMQWVSLLWSRDHSTMSALGTVPSDSGVNLYLLLRVVYSRNDGENGVPDKDALLEQVIRDFRLQESGDVRK